MAKSLKLVTSVAVLGLILQACSSGSGGGGSEREIDLSADLGSAEFVYDGPPPASDEIQNFKREFYDPLAGNDRCGQCHTPGGSANVVFVDQTDVNNAWQVAQTVVNLTDPEASEVVTRVSNGHNCWLGASQSATCATTVTGYIERWAAGQSASESEVQLVPRRAVDPSATRVMPQTMPELTAMGIDIGSSGELLDLLRTYCSGCHSPDAAIPQSPYFASSDDDQAYDAVRTVIELADPGASRIVVRGGSARDAGRPGTGDQ
jgi:mono/diheme cytochrome c family protein